MGLDEGLTPEPMKQLLKDDEKIRHKETPTRRLVKEERNDDADEYHELENYPEKAYKVSQKFFQ